MEETRRKQWLLVSDLDGTLTGDDEGIESLGEIARHVALVVNSSRPRESVRRTLDHGCCRLSVDGLITAMGTEVMWDGVERPEWISRFQNWDRLPVDELMRRHGMSPHRSEHQTRFKASYRVPADRWETLRQKVLERVPGSQVITSGESDFDVIPVEAGKDRAMRWVAESMGFGPERVIVAGDSGNDLAMFLAARRAIAVANARPELVEQVDASRTYFAKRSHARGVLEGLRYWGALAHEGEGREVEE